MLNGNTERSFLDGLFLPKMILSYSESEEQIVHRKENILCRPDLLLYTLFYAVYNFCMSSIKSSTCLLHSEQTFSSFLKVTNCFQSTVPTFALETA